MRPARPRRVEGNAAALAQWALARMAETRSWRQSDWNRDNTTTPAGELRADPAVEDNNTIEEDVDAVYMQFAMKASWATCRPTC